MHHWVGFCKENVFGKENLHLWGRKHDFKGKGTFLLPVRESEYEQFEGPTLKEQVLIMSAQFLKTGDFLCKPTDDLETGSEEIEEVLNVLGMMNNGLTIFWKVSGIIRRFLVLWGTRTNIYKSVL